MSKQPGRNDPCWCGSGKKYKRCHYRRDRKDPPSTQEVVETLKKSLNKRECLHPEAPKHCEGKIIKAHTIQRNGGLSKIARDGKVYALFTKVRLQETGLVMKLQGIGQASVFTGFCQYHDNMLFRPIEDQPLETSQRHALLLTFRAISRELYAKERAYELIPYNKSMDRGKDLLTQYAIQENQSLYGLGVETGLRDLRHYKALLDNAILTENCSNVYYYAIILDRIPDAMCSGAISPECDFQGNVLQDLMKLDSILDSMAFSLLATDKGGIAYFAWITEGVKNRQFIASLHSLSDDEVVHAILRFTFEYFENTYISPVWWEELPERTQRKLIERFEASFNVFRSRENECLKDDGIRAVSWKVIDRITNLHLGNK